MARPRQNRLVVAASLTAAVGLPISAFAQQPVQPAAVTEPAAQPTAPAATNGKPADGVRFNFKDIPIDQVLDFFAREGGVPVIYEAAIPDGKVTFVSAAKYTFDEALSILNLNLLRFGVHLRKQDKYLYLATLQDSMKRATPVADANSLNDLTPDKMVTVSLALDNAKAEQVAEQVKTMVGQFGGVMPVPTQNLLVIVETAAQVKRIREVIEAIDGIKPADAAFRLFPLKHAQAEAVLNSLKGLVAERARTVIVDKDGSQRVVQDQSVQGLNLVADPRTNSIIAVGAEARIKTCEEVIKLLDVPEGSEGGTQMVTFTLANATPEQVAQQITQLFAQKDPKQRPTVIPLPQASKVTVIGQAAAVAMASTLVSEVDPASGQQPGQVSAMERRAITLRLAHASPQAIDGVLARLLSQRQQQSIRTAPTPDGKGLIVMGIGAEIDVIQQIVMSLDVPGQANREVRVANITGSDAAAVLLRAQDLYKSTGKHETDPVQATLYAESGAVTLVGSPEALAAFEKVLQSAQSATAIQREVRMIELKLAKAADVAAFLKDLTRASNSLLNRSSPEPIIDVIEATNQLLVGGTAQQLAVIEALVKNLDSKQSAERPPMRILSLRSTDAANLSAVLQRSFDNRTLDERTKKPVMIEADAATNTLIVSAHPDLLVEIESIVGKLNESNAIDASGREIRIFPLKVARAEELAQTIDQMFPEPPIPLDPRTRQPRYDLKQPKEVTVRADRATNSLIVDAPGKRLAGFEQIVSSLDQQKLAADVVLRTYPVQQADLNAIATTIRNLAASGSLGAPVAAAPVTVSTEPVTRTLIVSGPAQVFAGIEDVLKRLDHAPERPPTELKMFALQSARADRVQPLVERVLTARAQEQLIAAGKIVPQDQRLVEVSADTASNTLIVNAPREVIVIADGMVKALDQQSVSSAVEVRVFRLTKGECTGVAQALGTSLKAQDVAGAQPATISAEPASNTVVIVGTREQIDRAGKLIEQLDAAVDRDGMGVKTITLKHARAETLAPVLEGVLKRESALDKLPEWARMQAIGRGANEPPMIRVAAEPRLNAIIVSGPRPVIDMAEQITAQLDVEPGQGADYNERSVRVVSLQNADAVQLAASLEAVFKEEPGIPPTIRVDAASNSLIVRGSATQMATLEELTSKLDSAAASSSRQMRTIAVDRSRADAELLARTLQRLLEQQQGVKVEVISAEDLVKRSKSGGATPEQPDDAPKKTGMLWLPDAETVRITHADSNEPLVVHRGWLRGLNEAVMIAAMGLPQPAVADQTAKDDLTGVTIAVDPATNTLMIVGSPRQTDRLARLAADLQNQMPAESMNVRVVTLGPQVDADVIAQMLRQTIAQIGRSGNGNPGGLTSNVSISVDPTGSSLIVTSNDTDFQTIGELIGTFSSIGASSSITVKVYPLTSVSSQRAIAAVNDLFSSAPRGVQSRRVRELELSIDGKGITAKVDPSQVRMTSDASGTSVVVAAPAAALPLIDSLIETIDQSPVKERLAIRRYELKNARSQDLTVTLQGLFDAQRQGAAANELPQVRFISDARTNSLLVTASTQQHAEVERLLLTADAKLEDGDTEIAMITLKQASPSTVQRIVEEVVVGRDPAKKDKVRVSAQDGSNLIVVRASKDDLAEVRRIIEQVDTSETAGLPVRSIKLERADAAQVASALQKFFADRASVGARPGQRAVNKVAVVGDKRTATLIVSAGDDEFAQVQELVKTFDTPTPNQDFVFKVVQLKNARVNDVSESVRNLVDELRWSEMFRQDGDHSSTQLFLESNERTNSIVLMGRGEAIATAERVITALDQPEADRAAMTLKAVPIKNADLQALRTALTRAFQTPGWRSWRGPDPDAVTIELDKVQRALILVGKADRVAQAEKYIEQLDIGGPDKGSQIESISLAHARADRAAASLRQFFADRGRVQGLDSPGVSVIGSQDGNVIIASGDADSMKALKDLLAQIDQPDGGKDRRIEVFVLKNAVANDAANVLRSTFARGGRDDEPIIITPQPSTNSLIVSAPSLAYDEVDALLKQLDAAPKTEDANIETVALSKARAQEVAQALKGALPPNVKVTVTPVARSNSIMLTGSREAIAIAMDQIKKIDTEPMRSGLAFRRYKLVNADVTDVSYTVEQILNARPRSPGDAEASVDYSRDENSLTIYAPTDAIEEVEKIIKELDVAATDDRSTEFVKLEYANAEQTASALKVFYGRYAPEAAAPAARNVTILSDPVSNSLVIRADKTQWEGIRALLSKLDTKDYDTQRQLAVLPLEHADAESVARALNDGLRAPLEEQIRQAQVRTEQQRRGQNQRANQPVEATVLVDAKDVPSVSAERQTNSLIVFAGGRDLERIRDIVRQLDVAGFEEMPAARIISLRAGKPSAIAATIRQMFLNQRDEKLGSPKSVLVVGDDTSSALIVRAPDDKFVQIKALADTLQEQGELGRIQPHVIRLRNLAAARLRQTILSTFMQTAKDQGESLAVEVDRASNALVVACSPRLFESIKAVIEELDRPEFEPGEDGKPVQNGVIGRSVTIVEVTNNDPAAIKKMLEDLGVTKPQDENRPGVVSEPVTIVQMASRRGIAVVGTPSDGRAIESLVRALDATPVDTEQRVAVMPLKLASANTLAATLTAMLKADDPANAAGVVSGPARALAEQVRRLQLVKTGVDQPSGAVDLTKPVRILAELESNSLIIASTQPNIDALREVVNVLDTLPVGESVLLRIFPLENASATRVAQVVEQLFAQGESLRRLPGTRRQGLPPTATGQALAGEIAVTTDERTNSLIVAGREEAVALVEVMIRDLDSDQSSKWIEPVILPLKFADAASLATKLQAVLVRGLATSPEMMGLQRQFGRLRMVHKSPDGAPAPESPSPRTNPNVEGVIGPSSIEADLFAPLTGLVIVAEEDLNALIIVGSPANNAVVRALVQQLDVEGAAAANTVRIYPLQHASSDRIAGVLREIFRQRAQADQQRREDELIVSSDVRTNSLIISTSPRSFAIVESMLKTLDGEKSNFSVGMHVLPITGGDVRQLAPRIERLMRERINASQQAGGLRNSLDAFSIEPEPTSNLLIVAASDENLQVVKELVAALTADADRIAGNERVDVIQLGKARAAEMVQSLTQLYVEKEVAKRGVNSVTVTPNERLNAVVVSGNEQDIIELRSLAKKLDSTEVLQKQQIKWFELRSASATEVVRLIENVLAGRPVGGSRGLGTRQATRLQFLREQVRDGLLITANRPPAEADVDGAIKDLVTLNADPRTNSVWVTAPESLVKLIAEMIEDIEKSAAGQRKIEKFQLKNADATRMGELLKDIFNLEQRGDALVLVPANGSRSTDEVGPPSPTSADSSLTAVPDERQQLAIAVDDRTNTLVVSGTPDYLELVRQVVTELDNIQANERERRVYHLRNAKAKDIETTLRSYFQGESDKERVTLGTERVGSLMRRLEEEVTVVGDNASNKLVISTSPRYMQSVLKIVQELDATPPQVMIQVLLAEVTIDSDNSWGMDVTVGPFGGEGYLIGSKAAGAGVATALGVPNLAVSSADFGVLIRALEAQGKLEILSNPQVMVNNNSPAEIRVVEDIGLAGQTQYNQFGNTVVASVERKDAGIILNVTPSISSDGFVRMDIKPEISQLTSRVTQITRDQTAPIIAKRQIDTVVTVKDGQSVVIGGLIQTSEESRESKVPILGDIPLLGLPFRSIKEEAKKTELMVILTPRIIPGQMDAVSEMVEDVTEDSIQHLEDPTKIQDYLERIRVEIQEQRRKSLLRSANPPQSVPDQSTLIPSGEHTPTTQPPEADPTPTAGGGR